MFAFIDNWSFARKTLIAFAFLAVMVLGLTWNGIASNLQLGTIAARHVERGIAGISGLAQLRSGLKEERILVYSHYNLETGAEAARIEERFEKNHAALRSDLKAYAQVAGDEFQADVEQLSRNVEALIDVNGRILAARQAGQNDQAFRMMKADGEEASRAALDQAEKLIARTRERSANAKTEGESSTRFAFWLTAFMSVATLITIAVIWFMVGRTVAAPIAKLSETTTLLAEGGKADVPFRQRGDEIGSIAKAVEQFRLAAIARAEADARVAAEQQAVTTALEEGLASLTQGDLTAQITADFPPAYAALKTDFNEALASLRGLIGSVMESTAAIRTGSGEIAQASEDLARRTEANAASLEETSAAVTQMDGRLKATAEAATRTVERADGAIATVSGGRGIADEAVQAMARVAEGAKGIDSVIEGLDKIAFQTRVLAMNAAVEAGRAGEAGRGFAVVADLVSALAMRSEEEAARARDQLTATQTDIGAAVEMVQKVDTALAAISGDVGEVHALLGHIATDNQAQSTAITQISVAIGTMDQSTQQNAAMVEQTSAAARNLTSEVGALAEQAAKFTIGSDSRRPAARPAPAKPVGFKPAKASKAAASSYVSPVKPLPSAAHANGNGAAHDDWTSL